MVARPIGPIGPQDPAHIVIVANNYWPEVTGNAPYVTGLAEHLAARGNRVEVVTGFAHYPEWRPLMPRKLRQIDTRNGVRIVRHWHAIVRSQTALHRAVYELSSLAGGTSRLVGRRPDLTLGIVPNLGGAVLSYLLSRRFNSPFALVFQDLMGRAAEQNGVRGGARVARVVGSIELRMARQAAAVGIVADGFRDYLEAGGVDQDRLHRLRNWSHTVEPTDSVSVTRQRLGWADDEFICLHSGNMGRKQGLDNLLRAAQHLQICTDRRMKIVLAGDGNDRARLQAEARAMGLSNVAFIGLQPSGQYESMLRAADLLIVNQRPSVADAALPSKLTSYFPAGRPIVAAASASSETAREIDQSGAGVLVEPDDPAALADAIAILAARPQRAARLGSNARDYARTLSPRESLARYDGFIRCALNGGMDR